MNIRFVGKNLTVTGGMKEHFEEKLERLDKYAPGIVEAHVILRKEKYFFEAEIALLAKNFKASGEGKSKENVFTAIDEASVKIEKQLKKFREKLKDHHKKNASKRELAKAATGKRSAKEASEEAEAEETLPLVIPSDDFASKPMPTDEASLELEASKKDFLVFFNVETQRVNVIFKRDDGHHGLIEPNF